jgi:hypothetical protein
MSHLPAELVSSIIAYVWKDSQRRGDHQDINSCSLCSPVFYRESRLWMFKTIEFRDCPKSTAHTTHTTHGSSLRVLNRLSQLRTLMQHNPALGDNVTSLALQFPWDEDPHSPAIKQRDANVAFLLKETRRMRHLTFEASSRPEWDALGSSIRDALHAICSSKHISILQFSRIVHLPTHIMTASTATSVRLRDVSLDTSLSNPCYGCSSGVTGREGSQISNLSVEYSSINDALSIWPLTFGRLRRLHTRLAVSTETQQFIDATRKTLEDFSCEGKAMVRSQSLLPHLQRRVTEQHIEVCSKGSSEEAAGVGPFCFQGCDVLRSLAFRYCSPRGSINGFTSVLIRSLESIEQGLCLDNLNITFQTSTCADLIPLFSSPLWSQLDMLFSQRYLFRRVHITLEPDGRLLSRQFAQANTSKSNFDMAPFASALNATTCLPHLLKAKAISFYLNSMVIPDTLFYPPL